jgi:hypothetical protein
MQYTVHLNVVVLLIETPYELNEVLKVWGNEIAERSIRFNAR